MNESVGRILANCTYCTIATVNENGCPWNVPLRFAYDDKYIYFRSPAGTIHGSNIEKDGRISAVIVDTNQSVKGAVYLHSSAQKLAGTEEANAKQVLNSRFNNPPDQWEITEYYKIEIGELDGAKTKGEMYYFQTESSSG